MASTPVAKIETSQVLVRATFSTPGGIGLDQASALMTGIVDFIDVAVAADGEHLDHAEKAKRGADRRASRVIVRGTGLRSFVRSIRYGSPFEVLVYLSAGSAATVTVTLAVDRAISTFNKIQDARIGKAKADVVTALAKQVLSDMDAGERSYQLGQSGESLSPVRKIIRAQNIGHLLASFEVIDEDAIN